MAEDNVAVDAAAAPPRPAPSTATLAVTAGRPPRVPDGPLNPPVVLASTYHAGGETGYGRYGNETWAALEAAVGALEGGTATAFASGMAASAAALTLLPPGGTVVAPDHAYYATLSLLRDQERHGRLTVRQVDVTDVAAATAALDGAAMLWVETPTNPLLRVADVPALTAAARRAGALTVVDSTFATPVLQRPLEQGADVVVHSATKFLSGHSDLLMGVVVTGADDHTERVRAARGLHGSVPGTFEAWLALRGLRTLHLRVRAAQANATELAARLAGHRAVTRVHYPGFGAMLSIEAGADAAAAEAVSRSVRLWVHATSLGGVESSLERRRRWPGESTDVPETLLRLSVGVEDVEDLWADLSSALDAAGTQPG